MENGILQGEKMLFYGFFQASPLLEDFCFITGFFVTGYFFNGQNRKMREKMQMYKNNRKNVILQEKNISWFISGIPYFFDSVLYCKWADKK